MSSSYRNSKRSSISFGGSSQLKPFASTENVDATGSTNINSNDNGGLYVARSPMYSPLDYSSNGMFNPNYNLQQQNNTINNTISNGNLGMTNSYTTNHSFKNDHNNIELCSYNAHFPLFGMDWSMDDFVCLSSYKEDSRNKLTVIQSNDLLNWNHVTESDITYPVTNIQWLPSHLHPRQLATASDSLRIWSLNEDNGKLQEQINLSLCKYKKQQQRNGTNNSHFISAKVSPNDDSSNNNAAGNKVWDNSILGELPPVTSFHWNPIDTNLLVSSSIDTTCIVWDLQSSNYVKTQLIAHDSEVYDVKFLTKSTQLFASCGGDGSVRVFDLRSLAHSTIIYEPPVTSPGSQNNDYLQQNNALLRLEPSPNDPNILATFKCDSTKILILDMRNAETPVLTLDGHSSSVNQIKWHPTKRNVLLSCGDDCQALYWDLNTYLNTGNSSPLHRKNSTVNTKNKANNNEDVNMLGGEISTNDNGIEERVLDTPSQFFSNNSQEINNIVWRPQRGDWFGSVGGKKFQNIRIF